MSTTDFDVVVIGGGPAGSTTAGFLAQAGLRVAVVEKEHFPRYHIGESLLSATMPIFDALGVMPDIERAGFIKKPGGTFLWGSRSEPWSFFFREDPGGRPHAYHVLRSQFDEILLRHAAKVGAVVHEGWQVNRVEFSEHVTVDMASDQGESRTLVCHRVVDSSGQAALLGRRDGLRTFDTFFKNLAVFGYYEGAERLAGELEGNILSATSRDGWLWFIPLHDGTTSIGAVVDAKAFGSQAAEGADALYQRLIEGCPLVAQRLAKARMVSPVRIIRDYSYCSDQFYGPGYLLAGDAACFIDPVFSTGVHLACMAGFLASRALVTILEGGDEVSALKDYDSRYRTAFERYRRFLYFFYDHHADPDSYFWQARKLLNPETSLEAKAGFIRLVSGGEDWQGDEALAEALRKRHERLASATARGRFAAIPDADLFRVAGTKARLRDGRDG